MLKAVTRQAAKVDVKIQQLNSEAENTNKAVSTAYFFDHYATPEDIAVSVTEEDFLAAHRELIPSVSAGELAHYERVRATFEGGRGEVKSRPVPLTVGRTVSGGGPRSARGKGKGVMGGGKGKGKAVAVGGEDDGDEAEYEDDYGVEAGEEVNGKGKGKAVATFQEGTASDDEGLYDE